MGVNLLPPTHEWMGEGCMNMPTYMDPFPLLLGEWLLSLKRLLQRPLSCTRPQPILQFPLLQTTPSEHKTEGVAIVSGLIGPISGRTVRGSWLAWRRHRMVWWRWGCWLLRWHGRCRGSNGREFWWWGEGDVTAKGDTLYLHKLVGICVDEEIKLYRWRMITF